MPGGGGVFLPEAVFTAPVAGTSGDRGRLLGAAGDGGLFLGLRVLRSRQEVKYEQNEYQR